MKFKDDKDSEFAMMIKRGLGTAMLFVFSTLLIFATSAEAKEGYAHRGNSGFADEFYLIGGKYTLFLFAKRPIKGYNAPETRSCVFGGALQRVWPNQEPPITLGSGVLVSTIVPHKLGPVELPLPPGRYRLFIATLTDCDWGFSLENTDDNSAGLAPIKMLKIVKGDIPVESASVGDQVQFLAQYRTDHNVQAPVSGVVQIIHGGTVVYTFPLQVGTETAMYASAVFANVHFDQSDRKYLGKNAVKFLVKIGTQEFTSTGEFTLIE